MDMGHCMGKRRMSENHFPAFAFCVFGHQKIFGINQIYPPFSDPLC